MMIILSWNVRGLNNIPRKKAIHNLVVDHNPYIFYIQETKLSVESMVRFSSSIWSWGQCQCVVAMGSVGGLAIFWICREFLPLVGYLLTELSVWWLLFWTQER